MKTIGASRIIAACLVASGAVVAANPPSGGDYIVLGVDSNTGKLSDNNADQLYTADKIESSVYEKCVADPMWTWGFFASSLTCPRDGFYDDYHYHPIGGTDSFLRTARMVSQVGARSQL